MKASEGKGVTGEVLLQMLERRLDNVVFRLGFAPSQSSQARQLVRHGHYHGERPQGRHPVVPREGGRRDPGTREEQGPHRGQELARGPQGPTSPEWLDLDADKLRPGAQRSDARDSIPVPINEQLIVELYSK